MNQEPNVKDSAEGNTLIPPEQLYQEVVDAWLALSPKDRFLITHALAQYLEEDDRLQKEYGPVAIP